MKKSIAGWIADAMVFFGGSSSTPVVVADAPAKPRGEIIYQSATTDGKEYDPDQEFIELTKPRVEPFDLFAERDLEGRPYEAQGQLYEVSQDGKSYRLRKFNTVAELRECLQFADRAWKLLESRRMLPEIEPPWKLREAGTISRAASIDAEAERVLCEALTNLREDAFNSGFDYGSYGPGGSDFQAATSMNYGSHGDVNAEYIPLMGGPWAKQLYLYQYLDMHRKSFEAYNHNPIAHQLVEIQTAFTLGRGIDHTSTSMDVDEVWREFVDRTGFYDDLENIATDLWWAGEMMMEFWDDAPEKGYTDYRMIDPSTVWEIVTDPEDIQKVYYYHQQYSTPYQQYTEPDIQMVKYIIRHIPADSVFHLKLNVSKYEKRGRTDLFSILGWVKRLKDLMNARVIKGQLEAAFVFDIEVASGDADVTRIQGNLPDPFKPGSLWVHNKALQMKAVSSSIKANEQQPDVATLLNIIAVGFGIPKEFIGEVARAARAGALVATEPGTKRFEKRQRLIERICHTVADRVIRNAIKAGRLKEDDILVDARSVKKLAQRASDFVTRDDVKDEYQQVQDQHEADAQNAQKQMYTDQTKMVKDQAKRDHELALNDQKHAHSQALAQIKGNTSHTITRVTRSENSKEAVRLRTAADPNGEDSDADLTQEQNQRIASIKKTGKYSKELLEFIFPAIAQEDRSAKLKDLALAEAMQWLPKSIAATMAAKELNITTYSFEEAYKQILDESKLGLSIAHVYGQDPQHVPETTMAQDVQMEEQAKQPVTPPNVFENVPVPPKVAGEKQVPVQSGGGGQPNSGDTKRNAYSGPQQTDPTAKPHGYSAEGNHPMAAAGAERIKKADLQREAIREGGAGSGNFGHAGRPGAVGGSSGSGGAGHTQTAANEPGVVAGETPPWELSAPAPARYPGDDSIYSPAIKDAQTGEYALGRRIQGTALNPPGDPNQVAMYTFIPDHASTEQLASFEAEIKAHSDHAQLHPGSIAYVNEQGDLVKTPGNNYWVRGDYRDLNTLSDSLSPKLAGAFGKDTFTTMMTDRTPGGTQITKGAPLEHMRVVVPFAEGTPKNSVGEPSLSQETRDQILRTMSGSEGRHVWEHPDFNGIHLAVSAPSAVVDRIYPQIEALGGLRDHEEHHNAGATRFIPTKVNLERYPVRGYKESLQQAVKNALLKEALGPALKLRNNLEEIITSNANALRDLVEKFRNEED